MYTRIRIRIDFICPIKPFYRQIEDGTTLVKMYRALDGKAPIEEFNNSFS